VAREELFQIINLDANGFSLLPPNTAGAEIFSCPDDFIGMKGIFFKYFFFNFHLYLLKN
jgi:hypothetical protein